MQILLRLKLPNDSSVRHQRVLGMGSTYYSWNPENRKFVLKHRAMTTQVDSVMGSAVAMRVKFEAENALPDLSPLVPPQRPVHRTAWDFGFSKKTHRRNLDAAREEAERLKVGGKYRFVERPGCIFVFEPPPIKHTELTAILWSTARDIRADELRTLLRVHCSR